MEPGGALKAVSQLRRGVLEYCVLALLRDGPRYGVELVRDLGSADAMVTSEGTIYPLLSRLRRDELVETSWQESPSGPPRRYYALTADGRRALAEFTAEWANFRDAVEHFIATDTRSTDTHNTDNGSTDTSSGGPQ
jgi:PadR family transcriptional regulator, regulatory protein PadR